MFYFYFIITMCFLYQYTNSLPARNESAVLISKYAKVARWGLNLSNLSDSSNSVAQGRSTNNGQSYWTPRFDQTSRKNEQNTRNNKKTQVVYAISNKPSSSSSTVSKTGNNYKNERIPGVGEVLIQDRFNPRPYFQYSEVPSSESLNSKPQQYPVYKPPESSKAPSVDLYTSPFNSYNPPNVKPSDDSQNLPVFPPNSPPPTQSYLPPPPPPPPKEETPSLGPPLAPPSDGHDGPPRFPPKDENDVYYPPDDIMGNHDQMPEMPEMPEMPDMPEMPKNGHMDEPMDDNHGPSQYFYPPDQQQEVILDHPPAGYKPHKDMAEDDMSPPPADVKFPTYLYDQHGYDDHHHVYEEVEHPTTQKPEKQRVSNAHYSYYYLGRKLWYIPLYFSVYFIIYVTILIIKSIVRHKIEFKHHFERESRALNSNEQLNQLHESVEKSIESTTEKYENIM